MFEPGEEAIRKQKPLVNQWPLHWTKNATGLASFGNRGRSLVLLEGFTLRLEKQGHSLIQVRVLQGHGKGGGQCGA
jgi:hypothetical protein